MSEPIICFGQQPCGFFPKRFLYAKIVTARKLQREIGGEIVFFFHDSDHDPRETTTVLRERDASRQPSFNFDFANKTQKQFSPLYAKRVLPDWQAKVARQVPNFVSPELVEHFKAVEAATAADFCRAIYERMDCSMEFASNFRAIRNSENAPRRSRTISSTCPGKVN